MALFNAVSFHDGKWSDAKTAHVSASSANRMPIPQRFIRMLRPDWETHGALAKAPCLSKLSPRGCCRSGSFCNTASNPRLGQRAGIFAHLLADLAETWINRWVVSVRGLAVHHATGSKLRTEGRVFRVVRQFGFFLSVHSLFI